MAPSRVHPNKVQANTFQEGIEKSNNFQAPIAQIDNDKNRFDVAELNVLDKVEKLNTSNNHVGEDTFYLDAMCRTVSTFPSQAAVDYGINKPRPLLLQCLDGGEMQHIKILTLLYQIIMRERYEAAKATIKASQSLWPFPRINLLFTGIWKVLMMDLCPMMRMYPKKWIPLNSKKTNLC
jgi:hypothetical protein